MRRILYYQGPARDEPGAELGVSLGMKILILSLLVPAFAAPASAEISRNDLKDALKRNPDLLIETLRENRKAVFEVMMQAMSEAREEEQSKAREEEKKELERALKNPLQAAIDKQTHIRGPQKAKITVVEYSDFQCPYCRRGYQTVEELRKKYGEKMRFIYKHLPLPMHPQAMPAARYMEAAALQSKDKAWEFHDKMFENQDKLSEEFYLATGKELGLDIERLKKDAASEKVQKKIAGDIAEADKFKISGTPGFLVNGIPLRGAYPAPAFIEIIEKTTK